jgi:hypothetical protein
LRGALFYGGEINLEKTNMKNKPTETLELVVPEKFNEVVQTSKIELNKAQQHAVAFAPSMTDYHNIAATLTELNKIDPSSMDAKRAREARLKMVKVRTAAEEIKDQRKEGIKAEGDLIQALYNVVKNTCIVTEGEFAEIEKHQERKEQQQRDALKELRINQLAEFGTDVSFYPLDIMTDEQFARVLDTERIAFQARKDAAEKAEQDRIAAEKKAEEDRIAREKADAEAREAQRVENERLKKQEELRQAAEVKRLLEEQEKVAKYANRLINHGFELINHDADFGAKKYSKIGFSLTGGQMTLMSDDEVSQVILSAQKAEEKEIEIQIEREKAEKERQRLADIQAKERAEAEKKLAAERAEREKAEAELKAKRDAEAKIEADKKQALLAPDKDKVNQLYVAIKGIAIPEFKTQEAYKIGTTVQNRISDLLAEIKELAKTLK